MRLSTIDSILIRALYLTAAGIFVMQTLGEDTLVSLLFAMTFLLVAAFWFTGAIRQITWCDGVTLFAIVLALMNVILNAKITGTALSFGYLKKFIMFSFTLLFFQTAYKAEPDEKTVRFLGLVNSFLAVYLIYFYYTEPMYTHWMNNRVADYVTFRFTNPNLVALFLICLFMGELLQVLKPMKEKRSADYLRRGFHILLACAMLKFIQETKSRNCILVAILVIGCFAVLYLRKRNFRIAGWFSVLVALFPMIFLMIYISVIEMPFIQSMFSFMSSKGKELDTRLTVWLPALETYFASPILGSYSQISNSSTLNQLHNSHLEILASYGTVILMLVSYLICRFVWTPNQAARKTETALRLCFSGIIFLGMGEAAIFSGGLGIYIYAGVFLLLMRPDQPSSGDAL